MNEFAGRAAVITGAASGIGRAMAERFAREGMNIVLADIDEAALVEAAASIEALGARALAVRTDVMRLPDIENLVERATDHFGDVHILCPNAGVSGTEGRIWETTAGEWEWIVGVNLLGVAHCIRLFLPRMLAHGEPGHVVFTASVLGLRTGPGLNIYSVTKHSVVRMGEGLYFELREAGSRLGVSVLCPSMVATRIVDGERNWPEHLRDVADPESLLAREVRKARWQTQFAADGIMRADEIAQQVLSAIRDERFYILPHPEIKERVRDRMERIINEESPG